MVLIYKRSSLIFVLSISMVLWEGTTIATAANTDIFTFGQKVTVEMDNLLATPVTIHCKSKDNDLGPHVVDPHKFYSFNLTINFWGTTLFFCGVHSQGKDVVFDVYKASRDQNRCPHFCQWNVNTDGMEGFKQDSSHTPDIVIPWK